MVAPALQFSALYEGITFRGTRASYAPGFYVQNVEGILEDPDTRQESIASGVGDGDGEFDTPTTRQDPRIIVLTGYAYSPELWELGNMINRLKAAGTSGLKPFTWYEFGERYTTTAKRGTGGSVRRRGSTGYADFALRLRAPRQTYFGARAPENTAGPGTSIELVNRGSYTSLPVLTITGTMPSGYKLVADGVEYVVSQPLAAGQTHQVDMRTRLLTRNGVAQMGAVSAPRRISIPAYSAKTIALVPVAGVGQLSGVTENAFI